MEQPDLPFTELIEAEANKWADVPHYETPKDINEHLLECQYQYLVNGSQAAWARLWQIAQCYCESRIVREINEKRFKMTDEEKVDKAMTAVMYVLRRYTTRPGWYARKSMVSQLKGGVMHALYYNSEQDALVDYVDDDTLARLVDKTEGEEDDD